MTRKNLKINDDFEGNRKEVQFKISMSALLRERIRNRVKDDPNLGQINLYVISVLERDLNNHDWRNELANDLKQLLRDELGDLVGLDSIERQLAKLSKSVGDVAEFSDATRDSLSSMMDLRIEKTKAHIVRLLAFQQPLPNDPISEIAIQQLIESQIIYQTEGGIFYLVPPDSS